MLGGFTKVYPPPPCAPGLSGSQPLSRTIFFFRKETLTHNPPSRLQTQSNLLWPTRVIYKAFASIYGPS